MKLKLRQEREKRGWSLKKVAKEINITSAMVSMLESGQRKPSYEVLVRLEDLFGLPHRELFAEVADDEDAAEKGNKENSL